MSAEETGAEIVLPAKAAGSSLTRRSSGLASRRARLAGTVYLLLDHSASMADAGKLPQLFEGALRLFGEAWRRDYAIGLIAFSDRARCLVGATRNVYRFQKRLLTLEPEGRTAMASAIRLGTARLRRRRGQRVLVLITDGMPDSREATLHAAELARAHGIELIVIGTDGADEAFLAALTPKPRLHPVEELAEGMEHSAKALP